METKYYLIWHGEIIESNLSKDESDYLQKEYNLAYKGGVTKKIQMKGKAK